MGKHTPGPWEITGTLGKIAITIPHKSIGIAPYTVCHIWPHIEIGDPQANAALIAAAPELLEACKYALTDEQSVRVKAVLRLAIAKAEGK